VALTLFVTSCSVCTLLYNMKRDILQIVSIFLSLPAQRGDKIVTSRASLCSFWPQQIGFQQLVLL
jgi:hypothetical protein